MKTSTEVFAEQQAVMPDKELIELAEKQVSELARTGGRSHRMCVPPMITDTDMLLSELIRRFKELSSKEPVTDEDIANAANEYADEYHYENYSNEKYENVHKRAYKKGARDSRDGKIPISVKSKI